MPKRDEIYGSLTREQRARVWRAVRDGQALSNPEEAAAAARYARALLERRPRWRRPWGSLARVLAVSYVATQLFLLLSRHRDSVPTWPAVVLSFFLFTHIYGWLTWPRRREAYAQAERGNSRNRPGSLPMTSTQIAHRSRRGITIVGQVLDPRDRRHAGGRNMRLQDWP